MKRINLKNLENQCVAMPIDRWLENYQIIGIRHKYSEEEIEEYKGYILKCHDLQNKINQNDKQ